jgi:hypothetical protein
VERDGGINKAVSTKRRSEIFFDGGLDSQIAAQPVGQISPALQAQLVIASASKAIHKTTRKPEWIASSLSSSQ